MRHMKWHAKMVRRPILLTFQIQTNASGAVFFVPKDIEQGRPVSGTSDPSIVGKYQREEQGKEVITMSLKKLWTGTEKLVISIDCGTTYSKMLRPC